MEQEKELKKIEDSDTTQEGRICPDCQTPENIMNEIDTEEPVKKIKKKVKVKKKKKRKILNAEQEKFCQLFASDKEFFGNGVRSYIEAYKLSSSKKDYNTAKSNAYRLLTLIKITNRINELFDAGGLNDTFVDKQLEKLLTQDADFRVKATAIKEYNILKARITNKHELINPVNITITRGDSAERGGHISATGSPVAQEGSE